MKTMERPYINLWIGNLGKYNEGYLVGDWFSLPVDMDEVAERIGLNAEYEEWQINDYETNISGLEIHHYADIEKLNELAERLESLEEYELYILNAYISEYGYHNDIENILDSSEFENAIVHYDVNDMTDIAYNAIENGLFGDIPDSISNYIDYEKLGRDLSYDGTFVFLHDSVCVEFSY